MNILHPLRGASSRQASTYDSDMSELESTLDLEDDEHGDHEHHGLLGLSAEQQRRRDLRLAVRDEVGPGGG